MRQYANRVSENCLNCKEHAEEIGIYKGYFPELLILSDNSRRTSRNYLKLMFLPMGETESSELAKYTKICGECEAGGMKTPALSEAMKKDGFLD